MRNRFGSENTEKLIHVLKVKMPVVEPIAKTAVKPTVQSGESEKAIVKELESPGSASYATTMKRHGIREPIFGVKISELKKIQKRVKRNYQLALDLHDTGTYDAMYLAALIADDMRMTKADLQRWADGAYCTCGAWRLLFTTSRTERR